MSFGGRNETSKAMDPSRVPELKSQLGASPEGHGDSESQLWGFTPLVPCMQELEFARLAREQHEQMLRMFAIPEHLLRLTNRP